MSKHTPRNSPLRVCALVSLHTIGWMEKDAPLRFFFFPCTSKQFGICFLAFPNQKIYNAHSQSKPRASKLSGEHTKFVCFLELFYIPKRNITKPTARNQPVRRMYSILFVKLKLHTAEAHRMLHTCLESMLHYVSVWHSSAGNIHAIKAYRTQPVSGRMP